VTHPAGEDLLRYALEREGSHPALQAHVRGCAECAAAAARLRANAAALWRGADVRFERTAECLDDDMVAAMAEGSLTAEVRADAVRHLATCALCRNAVASVARALADPEVVRAVRATDAGGVRRWAGRIGIPVGAAAAAVLLVLVLRQPDPREGATHRGPPTAATEPLTVQSIGAMVVAPRSPIGTVAGAGVFSWGRVEGADRYRMTLFDASSAVVFETETADTVVALPDSVPLRAGQTYLWKVEARTGWDRWSPSDLVEFSIRTRSAP
jgi:hypothetical protein